MVRFQEGDKRGWKALSFFYASHFTLRPACDRGSIEGVGPYESPRAWLRALIAAITRIDREYTSRRLLDKNNYDPPNWPRDASPFLDQEGTIFPAGQGH